MSYKGGPRIWGYASADEQAASGRLCVSLGLDEMKEDHL
jgi:hypothetical protein